MKFKIHRTIRLCSPDAGDDEVKPTAIIAIDGDMPNFDTYNAPLDERLQMYADFYEAQAESLADILCGTLPGGTLDRLLGILLLRKASHFKVLTWNQKESEP